MATTIDSPLLPAATPGTTRRRWFRTVDHHAHADRETSPLALQLLVLAFSLYGIRDAFTGPVRFFAAQFKLQAVWFIPDAMSFVATGFFIWSFVFRRQSAWAVLFTLNIFTALILGWIFMSAPPPAVFSAIKMMVPIFLGFAFAGHSLNEVRAGRHLFLALSILSTIGLMLSPYIDYPWTGMTVETFGQTKAVGRVWWAGGAVRYGGFAGDSTMAAYMALFPFALVAKHYNQKLILALMIPIAYALYISTNKTAMGVAGLFFAYHVAFQFTSLRDRGLNIQQLLAKWSFALVMVPFALMILLSGVNLAEIDPMLFSMQDRINNTWVFPFTYMADVFPIGLIAGCGLGCFVYPMDYTTLGYLRVPVDNFYVSTYIMLGFPFIIFVVGAWLGVQKTKQYDKLLLIFMINVYAVTVQCYGPSTTTIFVGYCISDMFLTSTRRWRRRKRAALPE